jgi:hypothetical protein
LSLTISIVQHFHVMPQKKTHDRMDVENQKNKSLTASHS